jgi:hypothetical protein
VRCSASDGTCAGPGLRLPPALRYSFSQHSLHVGVTRMLVAGRTGSGVHAG